MFLNFIDFGFQTAFLGMEAHAVIGLRMKKMFDGGPGAIVGAHCMVIEKVAALTEAGATLLGGRSARTVVGAYRMSVRANEARLTQRT
jgi:hypothetical protein